MKRQLAYTPGKRNNILKIDSVDKNFSGIDQEEDCENQSLGVRGLEWKISKFVNGVSNLDQLRIYFSGLTRIPLSSTS